MHTAGYRSSHRHGPPGLVDWFRSMFFLHHQVGSQQLLQNDHQRLWRVLPGHESRGADLPQDGDLPPAQTAVRRPPDRGRPQDTGAQVGGLAGVALRCHVMWWMATCLCMNSEMGKLIWLNFIKAVDAFICNHRYAVTGAFTACLGWRGGKKSTSNHRTPPERASERVRERESERERGKNKTVSFSLQFFAESSENKFESICF